MYDFLKIKNENKLIFQINFLSKDTCQITLNLQRVFFLKEIILITFSN